nr:putative polycystin cation channel protein [Marseillevirus futianmevirus]
MQESKLAKHIVTALVENNDFDLEAKDIVDSRYHIFIKKYGFHFSWDKIEDEWEDKDAVKRAVQKLYRCGEFQAETRRKLSEAREKIRELQDKFSLIEERLNALEYAPGGHLFEQAKKSFDGLAGDIEREREI